MKSNLFICYSFPLMMFLKNNGVNYDVEAKHKITDNPLWVYEKSNKVKLLLDEWDSIKNTK